MVRLDAELASLDIVARARPEDKLRLVEAARRTSRTVAVTGDGVNDAPALTHSDVAVAMGSGSTVQRSRRARRTSSSTTIRSRPWSTRSATGAGSSQTSRRASSSSAEIFRATPLDGREWLMIAAIASAPLVLAELIRRTTGRTWVA